MKAPPAHHELFPFLPKEVWIGPYPYRVELVTGVIRQADEDDEEPVHDRATNDIVGEIDYEQQVIRLTIQAPHRMLTSFWHEVLHGISDLVCADLSEGQATVMAPALTSVLVDNFFAPLMNPYFPVEKRPEHRDRKPPAITPVHPRDRTPEKEIVVGSEDGPGAEFTLEFHSEAPPQMSPAMKRMLRKHPTVEEDGTS